MNRKRADSTKMTTGITSNQWSAAIQSIDRFAEALEALTIVDDLRHKQFCADMLLLNKTLQSHIERTEATIDRMESRLKHLEDSLACRGETDVFGREL
jgi:hypothetical protein